jgi:hypothetical protein
MPTRRMRVAIAMLSRDWIDGCGKSGSDRHGLVIGPKRSDLAAGWCVDTTCGFFTPFAQNAMERQASVENRSS